MRNAADTPQENTRPRKKRRLNIGAAARNSHQTKAASIAADSAKAARIGGCVQPDSTAKVSPNNSVTSTPVDSAAPGQSNPRPRAARSDSQPRSTASVAAIPSSASGMVRKNTARQCTRSTMNPPMDGPATAPTPTVVISSPMARPRSLEGNTEVIIAIPVPCVMAEPTPCNVRASSIQVRLGDNPAPAAPAIIMTVPKI